MCSAVEAAATLPKASISTLATLGTAAPLLQVAALEGLARAMFVEVMELRRARRRALESRTLPGHAKNLLGYCFSAYCLYRCGRGPARPRPRARQAAPARRARAACPVCALRRALCSRVTCVLCRAACAQGTDSSGPARALARMFSAVRALALGEDLRSDPVSTALGLGLAAFTRGHLAISGQLLSQARPA